MPTVHPDKLVPGVTPDDDLLVYWVESRTPGQEPHRVDLQRYNANGFCDCEAFRFKCAKYLVRRALPSIRLECWHIQQAKRYFTFECLNRIIQKREYEEQQNKAAAQKSRMDKRIPEPTPTVDEVPPNAANDYSDSCPF
jgi:hypothetical protein